MARIYSIGFEKNTLTSGVEANSLASNGTGVATSTTQVHSGSRSLKNVSDNAESSIQVTNSSSHSQYLSFWIYVTILPGANTTIALVSDGSQGIAMCFIDITSTGALQLYYSGTGGGFTQLGSNSSALSLNTWTQITLHIDDTAGLASTVLAANINGTAFASGTIAEFVSGNAGVPGGLSKIGSGMVDANGTGTWYLDDFCINDGSGSSQTSYPAIGNKLSLITPNAQGDANAWATQVGGTAGAANNFTRVDEITPDDVTSYNGSTVLGQQDLFKCADPAIGTDTVSCVQVMARYRNNTVDLTTAFVIQCEKVSAGTIASGSAIDPDATAWTTCTPAGSLVLYNDPDSNPWTESTLATIQLGYKISTAHTNAIDVTNVWAYVDHIPASGVQYYSSLATLGAG